MRLASDQRSQLDLPRGIPTWLQLIGLPEEIMTSLAGVKFVTADDLNFVDAATTSITLDGREICRMARTAGGQSLHWIPRAHSKRAPSTNMALEGRRRTSMPRVKYTGGDVNQSFDAMVESGVPFVALLLTSKLGMNTLVLIPECYAHYGLACLRHQKAVLQGEATADAPKHLQIHHVHVLAPWLCQDWFKGAQRALYARSEQVSISVNCGYGYYGLFKKPMLAAHMWFAQDRGFGLLHAGACRLADGRVAVISGPSATGKTELSSPLSGLRTPGRLEFVQEGSDTVAVVVDTANDARRQLIVDDMVAYRIVDGQMLIIDLEDAHYRRIDRHARPGDDPVVDLLAAPGSAFECSWENVGYNNETGQVEPTRHVTLDHAETDNPRVMVPTRHLPDYQQTTWGDPVKVDILIVGVPAVPGSALPAFSVLSRDAYIALLLAGLRANLGNQSIEAQGAQSWTSEGVLTLVPFSPMTVGEVAADAMLLRQLSPNATEFYFVATRYAAGRTQTNFYDGSWALRSWLESGGNARKAPLREHRSRFLGYIPELPESAGIAPCLLDPVVAVGASVADTALGEFDQRVIDQLEAVCHQRDLPGNRVSTLTDLRRGRFQRYPFQVTARSDA